MMSPSEASKFLRTLITPYFSAPGMGAVYETPEKVAFAL